MEETALLCELIRTQMSEILNNYNLSLNAIKGITSCIRTATGKEKLFEFNLKDKNSERNHILDDFDFRLTFDF